MKNFSYAKFAKYACIFIICIVIFKMCSGKDDLNKSDSLKANLPEQHYLIDSAATENSKIAATEKSVKDSVKIAKLKPLFRITKDEFQEHSWVRAKSEPAYRNMNGFYCYFAQDDSGRVSNLRFVGQYSADDWLFIKKVTFNIDGKNIEYFPEDMKTDHADGKIWEWYDESVSPNTAIILAAIGGAKVVKIRFHGSQYYEDKVMSESSKKNIKNVLEYYLALGGNF